MSVREHPLALVATQEPALRAGIRLVLEPRMQCIVAESPAEAVTLAERAHPDVCFVDGDTEALNILEEITRIAPDSAIVVLAHTLDEEQFVQVLRAGANGYLSHGVSPERLPAVVDSVLRGEAVVPRILVRRLCEELRSGGPRRVRADGGWVKLTRRETEVLDLLRQGLQTHAIARRLGLADVTVRRYRSSLFAKLRVHSVGELTNLVEAQRPAAPGNGGYARPRLRSEASTKHAA